MIITRTFDLYFTLSQISFLVIYQWNYYFGFFTSKGWNFHNRRSSEARPTVNTSPQPRLKGETKRAESYKLELLKFCLSDRGLFVVRVRRSMTCGYENHTPVGVKSR
jgi:hypothetical protein